MSQESRGNSQYLKTTILLANVVMDNYWSSCEKGLSVGLQSSVVELNSIDNNWASCEKGLYVGLQLSIAE